MVIKNLHFFDNDGYNLNFDWNSEYNYWEGNIYLPKVSVGIHASTSIYILEYFPSKVNADNTTPYYFPKGTSLDKIKFTWDSQNKFVDEFFMFNFDDSYIIKETSALTYTPNDGPECETLIVNRFDEYSISLSSTDNSSPLPIHIAFVANEKYDATTYNRTLIMSYNDKTIARIKFFAETIEEDERLKIWNSNLGYNITPEDTTIFYKSDIKEYKPDYQLLNEKRKELMMEGSNIYPYIGSYRAIINAIKFFGYDNLGIIEYWKNINPSDEFFGKIFHTSRYSLTKKETLNVGSRVITLPNEDYKKMNRIALVYSINQPTKEVDEWELPIITEKFTYTLEEALIKLFALRKKLNNEFMPGSSRISDVIGEGNYFGLQGITKLLAISNLNVFENELNISFDIQPGKYIRLTDNRYFNRYIIEKKGYKGINDTSYNDSNDVYYDYIRDFNIISNISDTTLNDIGINNNVIQKSENTPTNNEMSQLYLDYYNEVFVEHTRYEDEVFDDVDDITAPSSAKVVLINTTFNNLSFDNCELSFDDYEDNKAYWVKNNEGNYQVTSAQDITFDYTINETCTWVISRSKDQFDDDASKLNIIKKYYITEDYLRDDFIITDVTTTYESTDTNKEYPIIDNFKTIKKTGSKVFFTLPYVGYYDVTLEINGQKKVKKKCIKVEPYDIEIKGFYYDSRNLPEKLGYEITEGSDMFSYIQSKLNDLINWATTEKTALDNRDDLKRDFSVPTYAATYTDLDNKFINKGPYVYENMITQWYLLDNISYDISLIEPYIQYARYIKNGVDIKPYTWVLLTYNYGKIVGKINAKWTIRNEITGIEQTYEGRYFTCLIKSEGNYSITLTLEDTNGNKYKTIRNIFVVNKDSNYNIYQRFKEEYDDMIEREDLAKLREYSLS